jgi:peptidyl-prolyl cis-trans isomerase D
MALISKIRKNFYLIVVLIALGLGGFIVMDMTSGQQSAFGGPSTTLGKVDGQKLDYNEFMRVDQLQQEFYQGVDAFRRRDVLWNFFVEKALMEREADALGLGVGSAELEDLQFGPNPSPVVQQNFADPRTRQINRQQLNEFKRQLENNELTGPLRAFWGQQQQEIVNERLQSKLATLVSKAMYTPSWMAQLGEKEQNQQIDLAYVKIPFDELDNSEVSLSDEDFRAYLNENAARYERDEETRKLRYVVFQVEPSAEDSASWREKIEEYLPEFIETEDDSLFVATRYGSMDAAYLMADEVSPVIADTVFAMPLGSVYGPYLDGNAYKAVKVVDRKIIPDSVRSRHILRSVTTQQEYTQAFNLLDSLKTQLEAGAVSFDSLALQYGMDGTRTKGGDLGFAAKGQMVKPYNDHIFYQADIGELEIIATEFGLHLVEVTDKKFINNEEGVKLAFLEQTIRPSEETQKEVYERAYAVLSENQLLEDLEATVNADPSLTLETATSLKENDFNVGQLGVGQSSRSMVQWAFGKGKVGKVSPEIYSFRDPVENYTNRYVLAGLEAIQEPGLPDLEFIRPEIEPLVINEKKGERISQELEGIGSLQAAAGKYSAEVDILTGLVFANNFIPDLGNEPKVLGTAFRLEPGQLSKPIVGNSGVYVLQLVGQPMAAANTADMAQVRQRMSAGSRSQVRNAMIQALKDQADIKDNRSEFY